MNMKTLNKLFTILVLCIGLTSCFEGFLEEEVYDFLSPNNFYKTEADADAAVSAIYSRFVSGENGDNSFHRGALMIGEYPAESSSAQTSTVPYRLQFENYTWTPTTDGVELVWRFYYEVIFRANLAAERIPLIEGDQAKLKRYEAEARFCRGLAYLYLIRLFDNIPYTISSIQEDMMLTNMGNTDAIFAQIIEDFKFGEANLPVSYAAKEVGRATKGAAQAFLSKTYLTMAGYPWNKTENYALAAAKSEEIIKSGTYDLVADYANNFKEVGEHNKEYIYDAEFHSNINGSNWVNMSSIRDQNVTPRFSGWSSFGGTKNFYNDMLTLNPGDKRLATNIILEFKDTKTGAIKVWGKDFDVNKGLVHTWKYIDPAETGSGDQQSNINYHFTRYADVLLMHSEAVNNASSFSGSYDKYYGINRVRERAGLAPLSGLAKEDFNKSLIWERVCELCFEGHLWYDYKRMNCMEERVARKGINIGTNKKFYVFPIPVNELSRNPNLEQHPLWK